MDRYEKLEHKHLGDAERQTGIYNSTKTALTDEELEIVVNWGFIASTERPLNAKEKELYFKLTNA